MKKLESKPAKEKPPGVHWQLYKAYRGSDPKFKFHQS